MLVLLVQPEDSYAKGISQLKEVFVPRVTETRSAFLHVLLRGMLQRTVPQICVCLCVALWC